MVTVFVVNSYILLLIVTRVK